MMSFDSSSTLLATRTESMPTAIWIWDIGTRILRAVMIFHAPIAKATWHPNIDELLLIRCEGEESKGLVHLWDPSWESPKIIDFAAQIPGGKVIGKTVGRWMNAESGSPVIFFSDSQDCILASIGDNGEELPWQAAEARGFDIYGQQEESPLSLVSAGEKRTYGRVDMLMEDQDVTGMNGGSSEVDDTFRFRKFIEPRSSPRTWT
ncbi:WD repeat-containing [Hyphodiscus hymeniophilus]|uniref:WD repeat-containing n=1 Tax=Hyphodiscus hymeniophilus TaxID=353542 RepID=A0A9P7AUR5_9HELO|nr:WD repeat-containing [Hyphodiscus hymeniophilus]